MIISSFSAKLYRVPLNIDRDGCEDVLMVLNLLFFVIRIFIFPFVLGFLLLTENEISNLMHRCLRLILETLIGSHLASNGFTQYIFVITVCLVGCAMAISGLYSVFLFLNLSIMYVNGTRLWMLKLG